jgi:hypothetical protein
MASAELSRRVGRVVGYPPLSEMSEPERREFQEALLDADSFEDLPGKWQAAVLKAEGASPGCVSFPVSALPSLWARIRLDSKRRTVERARCLSASPNGPGRWWS